MAEFMFQNVAYRATVYIAGALTLRSRRSPCYRVSKVKVPKGMKSLPKLWVNITLLGLLLFFRQTAPVSDFSCSLEAKGIFVELILVEHL